MECAAAFYNCLVDISLFYFKIIQLEIIKTKLLDFFPYLKIDLKKKFYCPML